MYLLFEHNKHTTKSQHGIWQRLLKVQFGIVVAVIIRYVFGLFSYPVIKNIFILRQ